MWQLPKAAAQRALQIEKGLNINPPTRGWTDGVALTKPSTPELFTVYSLQFSIHPERSDGGHVHQRDAQKPRQIGNESMHDQAPSPSMQEV